jgi:hypothetical protein
VEATFRIAPSPWRAFREDEVAELGKRADVESEHLALAGERERGEGAGEPKPALLTSVATVRPLAPIARSGARPRRGRRDRRA